MKPPAAILVLMIVLFPSSMAAEDVSLRDYLESRIDEQDRRFQQEQTAARVAIEKALLSELRIQDRERDARYALKEEVRVLRAEIRDLDTSRNRVYGGLFLVGMIGLANLVKLFWVEK